MNEHNISLLETEIGTELEALNDMEIGTDEYKAAIDGLTKLIDRSIKAKELQQNAELKANELSVDSRIKREQLLNDMLIKREQMEKENIRGWIGVGTTMAGIILPIAVTIWGTKKSFEFERDGTITTIMGRGFIQKLLPKSKI